MRATVANSDQANEKTLPQPHPNAGGTSEKGSTMLFNHHGRRGVGHGSENRWVILVRSDTSRRIEFGNVIDMRTKMKYRFYIFILLLSNLFICSCNNSEKKYIEAESINTLEAFQIYVQEFQDSKFTDLARSKIDSIA